MKLKVYIVEPLGTSGMIHFAYQLCTAMAGEGVDVTLVTSEDYELRALPQPFKVEARMRLWRRDPSTADRPTSAIAARWFVVRWTVRRGVRASILVREWIGLVRFLAQARPDIIQFGMIHFPFQAAFLRWLRLRGLLLTQICHEFENRESSRGWARWLQRCLSPQIYKCFDAIFFLSERTRSSFSARFPTIADKTMVIPHGNQSIFAAQPGNIEILRQQYKLAPGAPVILFFGAMHPSKGIPDLIRAFADIPRDLNATLLIVGYPEKTIDLSALRSLASSLNIADRVVFDPRYIAMEWVGPLMMLSTAVVLPYRSATQSGVLHTAYSFSRPVVATDVGGLGEDVQHGKTGLLVPPGRPAELAAAIRVLIENPERAREMGAYARRLATTRHEWPAVASAIIGTYRKMLEAKVPSEPMPPYTQSWPGAGNSRSMPAEKRSGECPN